MNKALRPRRVIALIAAYTVALQALFLPLSMAAGGAPEASLCLSVASYGMPASASHAVGWPCAAGCGMQCCVHALAGPPQTVLVLALSSAGNLLAPLTLAPMAQSSRHGPQLARAPPAV